MMSYTCSAILGSCNQGWRHGNSQLLTIGHRSLSFRRMDATQCMDVCCQHRCTEVMPASVRQYHQLCAILSSHLQSISQDVEHARYELSMHNHDIILLERLSLHPNQMTTG